MKENVRVYEYKNGSKIIVEMNENVGYATFLINVKIGGKDENEKQFGLAHFLEHLFFKSTNDMTTYEIAEYLESLGAVINADTSERETNYHFMSLKENFEKCVEIYSKMFFEGKFDNDEIDKERKVILEEMKRFYDNIQQQTYMKAYKGLTEGTPYSHDVIGTEDIITNVRRNDILEFKKKYTPDKITFSIAGNIDFEEAKGIVEKYFGKLLNQECESKTENEIIIKDVKTNFVFTKKDNKQSQVYILIKADDIYSSSVTPLKLLGVICGSGMCSRFFSELREKRGLAYSCGASTYFTKEYGYFQIFIGTSNEKLSESLIAIRQILKELSENGVTERELEIAKVKMKSEFVYEINSVLRHARSNAFNYYYFKDIPSIEKRMKEVEAVTCEDIMKCAKELYNEKNYVVSVCGDLENFDRIKNAF